MSKEEEKIYAMSCTPYGNLDDDDMLISIAISVKKGNIERIKNVSSVVDKKFVSDLIDHLKEALGKMKGGDMK